MTLIIILMNYLYLCTVPLIPISRLYRRWFSVLVSRRGSKVSCAYLPTYPGTYSKHISFFTTIQNGTPSLISVKATENTVDFGLRLFSVTTAIWFKLRGTAGHTIFYFQYCLSELLSSHFLGNGTVCWTVICLPQILCFWSQLYFITLN